MSAMSELHHEAQQAIWTFEAGKGRELLNAFEAANPGMIDDEFYDEAYDQGVLAGVIPTLESIKAELRAQMAEAK
jgi:hypothetical protein